jgi:cell division initiation protein
MRITPLDIQQRTFNVRFRGFHIEEVSGFLEQIREEIEDLLRENASLKERIQKIDDESSRFRGLQELLGSKLLDARQSAEESRIEARREADLLLEKAQERAEDMISESGEKVFQCNEEIVKLRMTRKQFCKEMSTILDCFEKAIDEGSQGTGPQTDNVPKIIDESDEPLQYTEGSIKEAGHLQEEETA